MNAINHATQNEGKKDITGGCHCGFIKYTFNAPSLPFDAKRCNCTFCQKLRTTNYSLEDPKNNFHLLSPETKDDSQLGNYAPNVKTAARYFCKACGVHVWMEGYYEHEGHRVDLFMINLASVDQPQDGIDLSETTIQYFDGLTGKFGLRDTPWPNGLL